MKQNQAPNVITTQALSDSELSNLMSSIGTYLISQGLTTQVHSKSLLDYRAATPGKRGIFGKKSKSADVVVHVTELPISFSVDEESQGSIPVGLAFEISAPAQLHQPLASLLAPYAASNDQLECNAGQYLAGRTFNKRIPGVACEHCRHIQEITIPFSITRIEGDKGYGPGGSTTVVCSNSACRKSFPVNWDNIIVEIDMRSQQAQQQRTQTVPNRVTYSRPSSSLQKSFTQPKGKSAVWLGFGKGARVQGYDIPGGLIYVGASLPEMSGNSNDACLIDPRLEVSRPGRRSTSDAMGYWPRYNSISASCRGRYLEWLAGGCCDPTIDMGYVFLFFYGLERRLLVDGLDNKVPAEERTQIVNEVRRLQNLYGMNSSFQYYSTTFLAMEWVLFHRDEPLPDYLIEHDRIGMPAFRLLLAQCAWQQIPLPAGMALKWLALRPDYYKLRTPVRRCKSDFKELFAMRYREKFGGGLFVKPGNKTLGNIYTAASPSVRMPNDLTVTYLRDAFELDGTLKKIKDIAESCTVELEPYSRLIGKPEAERSRLAVCSRLPAALTDGMPEVKTMKGRLETTCTEGPRLILIKGLYETFGETAPESFNKKECEEVAGLVEAAGYGLAPHPHYHNMKIPSNGAVVVFPGGYGMGFEPSREFTMMVTILRLGSLVAQIDEDVSAPEGEFLKSLIDDNKELTAVEKTSLGAFLLWCLQTPQSAVGLKKSLAEISEAEKTAIGRILVAVGNADGRIDKREVVHLEKLYISLGLEKEQVASDLHALAAGGEPVTVGLRDAEPSHAIPPPGEAPRKAFVLNDELMRLREEETKQARALLVDIFAEEDEPAEVPEPASEHETADPLATLDDPYKELLQRLLSEPEWEGSAIEAVCTELGLMPDGAMEILNEWAFDKVEAPLIDYGEPIYIDIELAREIMNA